MTELSMPFFPGQPDFDRLPVYILRCDTATPHNLRIYAQGQLCRTDDAVIARIWTFEGAPGEDVRLTAEFAANGHVLVCTADVAGNAEMSIDDKAADGNLSAGTFSGEDLQGVYHGVVLRIDAKIFFSALGADFAKPDTFKMGVNLLRTGESVSSLVPQGEYKPLSIQERSF